MALLELSLGNPTVARAAIAHALNVSGRDDLPTVAVELLGFVRVHLVPILTGELGARLTMALLDDLEAMLDPAPADSAVRVARGTVPPSSSPQASSAPQTSSAPPASLSRRIARLDFRPNVTPVPCSMLGVLVVDPDPISRPTLARALLRAKWSVTVVDSPAEVAIACDNGEQFGIALVHTDHPQASAIVREVVTRCPSAAVVARSRDTSSAQAKLTELGVDRLDVRSSDAPPEELVDAIRRALGV